MDRTTGALRFVKLQESLTPVWKTLTSRHVSLKQVTSGGENNDVFLRHQSVYFNIFILYVPICFLKHHKAGLLFSVCEKAEHRWVALLSLCGVYLYYAEEEQRLCVWIQQDNQDYNSSQQITVCVCVCVNEIRTPPSTLSILFSLRFLPHPSRLTASLSHNQIYFF